MFIDWDDGLFPTTEIFDHWEVRKSDIRRGGLTFSTAQQSLLDSWCNAVAEYLETVCKYSSRCVILTKSPRPLVQQCIDVFAPKLCTLFNSSDGPCVVYEDESSNLVPTEGFTSPVSIRGPFQDDRDSSWKPEVMRREAKEFFANCQGHSSSANHDIDVIDELSFPRTSSSGQRLPLTFRRTKPAPSISQMTVRMLLDSQQMHAARSIDIPALDMNLWNAVESRGSPEWILDMSYAGDHCDAIAMLPDPEFSDRCMPRIRSGGRTKLMEVDFSHRQELHELRTLDTAIEKRSAAMPRCGQQSPGDFTLTPDPKAAHLPVGPGETYPARDYFGPHGIRTN